MIYSTKFSKTKFTELVFLVTIMVLVAIVIVLILTASSAFTGFLQTFMILIIGFFYGIYPLLLLYNYYDTDRKKEITLDDETSQVVYVDKYRTFRFLLSDIDSIVYHRSYYHPIWGYYTVYIKNRGYITISPILSIDFLVDYAKKMDIYRSEFSVIVDMD